MSEQEYKEALGRAKRALEDGTLSPHTIALLKDIFPELRFSEDEKIRKELIAFLKENHETGRADETWSLSGIERWIAWLEKQGEQKPIINVPPREVILAIWDLGNEWKELTNGSISTEYGTQLDYIQKHWHESEYYLREKQGEHNDSDVKDYNSIDPHFGKSIDKIEPNFNFKAGQWIVATGKCVYLITKIDGFNVTLVDVDGNEYVFDTSSLEDAHLLTIDDVKDGCKLGAKWQKKMMSLKIGVKRMKNS